MKKIMITLCLTAGILMIIIPAFLNLKAKYIKNKLISDYRKEIEYKDYDNEENYKNNSIHNVNNNVNKELKYKNRQEVKKHDNRLKVNKSNNKIIGILKIHSIDLEAPIILGQENLDYVVAEYRESTGFGQFGNVILAGHNNMKGSIFRNLYKLNKGEEILIESNNKVFRYRIYDKVIVEPNSNIIKQDLRYKELTLITCINHSKERLILKCNLVE